MKILLFLPTLALAGCALTPDQMRARSNYDVCRLGMGGPSSANAQYEASSRNLDCSRYWGAIVANQQAQNAATANLLNALNPTPPPPMPAPPMRCNSYRLGNSIQTNCN